MSQAQSHHLTPLDIGREVATEKTEKTEKRNLDPLAGRLVVFLHMTSPNFLIGGDSYLLEEGVIINTNLALFSIIFGAPQHQRSLFYPLQSYGCV